MLEHVSITIGGAPFTLWDEVVVHASVKETCRSASVTFQDSVATPVWPSLFIGQPAFVVSIADGPIFTGFVERAAPKLTPKTFMVTLSGRTKAADALDCTVDHTKPDYVNSHVLAVAQSQDRFGIGFAADFTPDGFDRWRPNPGDPLFHSLVPLVEEEGATLHGLGDGSIRITRAGESATPQSGALVYGVNIWDLDGEFDTSAQHSLIKCHGQSYKGNGVQNIAIVAEANNALVTRFRPFEEHHDRHTDRDRLKRRAKRRKDKEQGEGVRCSGRLRGWRDPGGGLLTPGKLMFITAPPLALSQYMLIESLTYRQNGKTSGGTIAGLHFVDPRAHGGKAPKVSKSGKAWGFDDSEAE